MHCSILSATINDEFFKIFLSSSFFPGESEPIAFICAPFFKYSLFNKGVFEGVAVIIKSQVAAISSGDLAFSKFHPKDDISFI